MVIEPAAAGLSIPHQEHDTGHQEIIKIGAMSASGD
jgi:hypothetical protein